MKRYECVKQLVAEQYDQWGIWMPGQRITVEPGTVLTQSTRPICIAIDEAVSLAGENGLWLEVYPQTLRVHFREISGKGEMHGNHESALCQMAAGPGSGLCTGMGEQRSFL